MIRYAIYLIACLAMEVLAVPSAFIVPLCPNLFPWFMTPDNPIDGDSGHIARTAGWSPYTRRVWWLLRNRAYGFKWSVLAAPVDANSITWTGDPAIKNRDDAKAGVLRCQMGSYWQYKRIWRIPGTTLCVMLNFGWLLDAYISDRSLAATQPRALFLFSPRLTAFHPAS